MLRPACCYTPSPHPHFSMNFLYRVILPPLYVPPPHGPLVLDYGTAVHACVRVLHYIEVCRKYLEKRSRPYSLISDGFLKPPPSPLLCIYV